MCVCNVVKIWAYVYHIITVIVAYGSLVMTFPLYVEYSCIRQV